MKKIIHISDLHFGTERNELLNLLSEDIANLQPDIVVVSGDLTQRARTRQYEKAKKFLETLPGKIICVPGNHDISLYNPVERFFYPFEKYKKWIHPSLCVNYVADNLAILGINSVTPYKRMGGFITDEQLKLVTEFFNQQPRERIKIIVMHHNLISSVRHQIINHAEFLISTFAKCNVNLVLSGHIHSAHIELLKHKHGPHSLYVITAGTPISTRTIEPNSFNIIEISETEFKLSCKSFIKNEFVITQENIYSL